MTYIQLLDSLSTLSDEQLLQDVTVYTDGDAADGILDHGHLYLEVDG